MTKLLISTLKHVVLWDGSPQIVLSGDRAKGNGNFNGITWDPQGNLYVAGSKDFRYCIHVYDESFVKKGELYSDLHQIHQIHWGNDRLYVTNTGKNRVEVWTKANGWSWVAWNPFPHDVDHINGVWGVDEMMYVSEFRHRPSLPSIVRVCDRDLDLLEEWKVGPPIHNVYVYAGYMYNLVSRQFKGVLQTNLMNDTQVRHPIEGEENNLVRGFARSDDHWFVGLSQWRSERGERHDGDATVVILDNDFVEVERITIKDVGPTNEIRLLDETDHAHNLISSPFNRG